MKIGLIGTGYWGRNHARVWRELKDEGIIDDFILCDVNENAVKPLAKDFGVKYETNPRRIIEDKSIDAVDISSSTPTHYTLAKNSLMNGKHVLVEKPMAENSIECEELINLSKSFERILMVGHIFRYHPALIELKNMISRGEFGDILTLYTRRLSFRVPRKDMGVLMALAIHDVDIYTYLLDEDPIELFAELNTNFIKGIEEDAHIIMKFPKTFGYIHVSWNFPVGGKIRELIIVGTESSAKIDYLKPDEIVVYNASITEESIKNEGSFIKRVPYKEPLKEELLDFVRCIKNGTKPKADMYVGKKAVEIIEKINEAASKKMVISI